MDPTASEIISRWDRLDSRRSSVKSLVQNVMEYCLPRRATVTTTRTEGQDLHQELFDSTAESACERFATGLYNFMWNPTRRNFMLLPPIEGTATAGDVARPLLAISEKIEEGLAQSNFEEAFYESALDLGTAGLTTLEVRRGDRSLYEFEAYPFEQVCFDVDSGARVDAVLRRFAWTARQIVQEFGEGEAKVGKSVWSAYNADGGKDRDKEFEVLHAAVPRADAAGGRDVRNMPVASIWVSVTDKQILRTSGWPQQRYLVARLIKASGERHGRSPGMQVLPDVKMLNKIEESVIVGVEGRVRPTILAPDSAFVAGGQRPKLFPGSILWYRVNPLNPSVKPEPFNPGTDPGLGVEYGDAKREVIKRAFYNDLFLILSDPKQRTATEVRGILGERLSMLGPSFGRLKVELFDPMIRILLSILGESATYLRGIPPEYLALARIRYISTLAIALQYAELSLLGDAWLFLSPLAEVEPGVFDHLAFDELTRGFLEKMAWPAKWLRPVDEVRALRERRMQFQGAQVQQALALQQMEMLPKMGKALEPGSPGAALMAEAA